MIVAPFENCGLKAIDGTCNYLPYLVIRILPFLHKCHLILVIQVCTSFFYAAARQAR